MTQQQELLEVDPSETADLLAHASEEDVPRHRWPRNLAELVDVLTAHYRRRGREADQAGDEARQVVLALASHFGGRPLYLPKGAILETALLHARIWHEHTGNNTEELAQRHRLTPRQIQKVIAQQGKYRRGLRQKSLFND